jgi:hypothetical protein
MSQEPKSFRNFLLDLEARGQVIHYKPEMGLVFVSHWFECSFCQNIYDDPLEEVQMTWNLSE